MKAEPPGSGVWAGVSNLCLPMSIVIETSPESPQIIQSLRSRRSCLGSPTVVSVIDTVSLWTSLQHSTPSDDILTQIYRTRNYFEMRQHVHFVIIYLLYHHLKIKQANGTMRYWGISVVSTRQHSGYIVDSAIDTLNYHDSINMRVRSSIRNYF